MASRSGRSVVLEAPDEWIEWIDEFHPEAADGTIAEYVRTNGWVVLTRDRDGFEITTRTRFNVPSTRIQRLLAINFRV